MPLSASIHFDLISSADHWHKSYVCLCWSGPRCCLSMLYSDICPIFFDPIECANRHIGWLVGWSANWHIGWWCKWGCNVETGRCAHCAVCTLPPTPTPTPTPLSKNGIKFLKAMLSTALLSLYSKVKIILFWYSIFVFRCFCWQKFVSVLFYSWLCLNLASKHKLINTL